MSAECFKHHIHLVGYMEDAFCPLCRLERAERVLRRLLASEGVRTATDPETESAVIAARAMVGCTEVLEGNTKDGPLNYEAGS